MKLCTAFLLCSLWVAGVTSVSNYPLLLVVSLDGFRYDYFDRVATPNLHNLANDGARVERLQPRFMSVTFPNHFSIATGMYEESHGIVANEFYDPVLDDVFEMGYLGAKWWDMGAVPIWILNQEAAPDRFSGGIMWPGSDATIRNSTSFYTMAYDGSIPFEQRVDTAISYFTSATDPANCVYLYLNEPDHTGHDFGPNSPEVDQQVVRVDGVIGYLVQKLQEAGLYDSMNLIVTSDHGMAEVNYTQFVDLSPYLDPSTYSYYGGSPAWNVLPSPGLEDTVYNALLAASQTQPFKVYKKADIPDDYHYKNSRRIMPILVEAAPDWDVAFEPPWHTEGVHGVHGFNNSIDEMQAFFVAHGPAFKPQSLIPAMRNIDIYPLASYILGLQPGPNNGTLDNALPLLRNPPTSQLNNNPKTQEDAAKSLGARYFKKLQQQRTKQSTQ